MKIRLSALAALIMAASLAPGSFAKGHHSSSAKQGALAGLSKGTARKGTKPAGDHHDGAVTKAKKDVEAPSKEAPPPDSAALRSPSKPPTAAIDLKQKPVEMPHDHHMPEPANAPLRNAIGIPIAPSPPAAPGVSQHVQAPLASMGHVGVTSASGLAAGHAQVAPGAAAASGKISGAAVVRPHNPATSLVAVGGPAKQSPAIIGTTLRPKR